VVVRDEFCVVFGDQGSVVASSGSLSSCNLCRILASMEADGRLTVIAMSTAVARLGNARGVQTAGRRSPLH
jgi:hypothetical protein